MELTCHRAPERLPVVDLAPSDTCRLWGWRGRIRVSKADTMGKWHLRHMSKDGEATGYYFQAGRVVSVSSGLKKKKWYFF